MECWYKHILFDWLFGLLKGLEFNGLSGMNLLIIPQGCYLFYLLIKHDLLVCWVKVD